MRYSIISAFVLCTLLIFQCSENKTNQAQSKVSVPFKSDSKNIPMIITETINFSGTTNDITYIADFKWLNDGCFSFVDTYFTKQAYVFNPDGALNLKLGRRGEGPGEYESPTGLTYDGNHFYLSSTDSRLNVYDRSGNFVNMFHLPNSVTISKGLFSLGEDQLMLPVFSRYSENSLYVFNNEGIQQKQFSPIDDDFKNSFDTFNPQGGVEIINKNIFQFFNHRFEVMVFDENYKNIEKILFHSALYIPPDYQKAKKINGGKEEIGFRGTFTQFISFKAFSSGYLTVIRAWSSKNAYIDTIEFWDKDFIGIGRFEIPEGETLIGSREDELIFFQVGRKLLA